MSKSQRFDERGDTLIEVLVTVVIVGMTAAAILGTLLISISSSTQHRYLANDDTLARSAIEAIKQQVELPQSPTNDFVDCSTSITPNQATGNPQVILADWTTAGGPSQVMLPSVPASYSGFSANAVQITGIECYDASGSGALDSGCAYTTVGSWTSITGSCANDTSGLLEVTVTVKDPSGYSLNLSTMVRNPNFKAAYGGMY